MRKLNCTIFLLVLTSIAIAQKKPLDHSVYDSWQSIGEKLISNDGNWVVYTINPQEGNNTLVIQSVNTGYQKKIARGYQAKITADSRYLIAKIKAPYEATREATIKKKRKDELPKDSLVILELGKDNLWKHPMVKEFKIPEKKGGWVVYHSEKKPESPVQIKKGNEQIVADSLLHIIDSLKNVITKLAPPVVPSKSNNKKDNVDSEEDADEDEPISKQAEYIADLTLRKLATNEEMIFKNVSSYIIDKNGEKLLLKQHYSKDSTDKSFITLYDIQTRTTDTISKGRFKYRNLAFSEDGTRAAFLALRTSDRTNNIMKVFSLWYYKQGMDSAVMVADKNTAGMQLGMTISENGEVSFSKSGNRLFFGTAPIVPVGDTITPDIDKVKLDLWHYNDPELQTVQLYNLPKDLQKNYLAVYDFSSAIVEQLGSEQLPIIYKTNDGDGDWFYGISDYGRLIETQWTGNAKKDLYALNLKEKKKIVIKKDLEGLITRSQISPDGNIIVWYDEKIKDFFAWDGNSTRNISDKINQPIWDVDYDSPSAPPPYGFMGWHEDNAAVYIYDKYDIWKVDLTTLNAINLTKQKEEKLEVRYVITDTTARYINTQNKIIVKITDEEYKMSAYSLVTLDNHVQIDKTLLSPFNVNAIVKAKDVPSYIFTSENYRLSPNLKYANLKDEDGFKNEKFISSINEQQTGYNWGTAELFKWTAYNGKQSEGIVYKPENFDPKKKYPMICYFYEKVSNTLHNYIPPAPTPSRLNISFFVSRGYIVFAPDISYGTGHPGRDAYNYVVSGTRALLKEGYIDSTHMAIQGQSWGGYQVAYIITKTNLYKAAWAGAPVVNMTSAYGGIRWESGRNRQFQYEKGQSRIGATLWEKPELYIENSPLFHLQNVKTPLVIMSNDKDGAVPWYQGIEFFTAMRRLGKKVWLLNYNGEQHNLIERKNRKDISIREQQYFDWLLKGERPAKWLTEGIPATRKGKDFGLELD